MLGVGMIMAVLPQRILELSGSVSGTGFLAAAFACTFVLFQIPVGCLSDRFGPKLFLGAGYLACAVSGILYYMSGTTCGYLLGRMLQGIGEIPVWSIAPAMLSLHRPLTKGKYIGIYNAALHTGLTMGSLSGILVRQAWGEDAIFLVFAALSALSAVLTLIFIPDTRKRIHAQPRGTGWTTAAFLPGVFVICSSICCYGAGYGIFISVIPAFLMDAKGAEPGLTGLFFTQFYLGIGLAQLLAGPLSDRYGRKGTVVLGLAAAGIGLGFFSRAGHPWLFPLLFLAASGLGTFCVSALALLNDQVPSTLNSTINAAFYFFWGIGYSAGPLCLGSIGNQQGWDVGFSLTGGLFALQAVACLILLGLKTREKDIRTES